MAMCRSRSRDEGRCHRLPGKAVQARTPCSTASTGRWQSREVDDATRQILDRQATLTDRERQVLDLLILGRANKVIAYELSISPRTVEIHRARVMDKMAARNLAELVRMVISVKPAD